MNMNHGVGFYDHAKDLLAINNCGWYQQYTYPQYNILQADFMTHPFLGINHPFQAPIYPCIDTIACEGPSFIADVFAASPSQLLDIALEQQSSTHLQSFMRSACHKDDAMVLLKRLLPSFMTLCQDPIGNYVAQLIVEIADESIFSAVSYTVIQHLYDLATHAHGTRVVQKLIAESSSRKKSTDLIKALEAVAKDLAVDPHGCYVILKSIEELRFDWLYKTLLDDDKVACSRFGVVVIKRMIAKTPDESCMNALLEMTTSHFTHMLTDPFGNYAVQHLLQLSHLCHSGVGCLSLTRMVELVASDFARYANNKYSCNTVELLAKISGSMLVEKLIVTKRPMATMISDRYGYFVLRTLLHSIAAEQRLHLVDLLLCDLGVSLTDITRNTLDVNRQRLVRKLKQLVPDWNY